MLRLISLVAVASLACTGVLGQKIVNPSFSVHNPTDSTVCEGWKKHSKYIYYDTLRANTAPGCVYIYNTELGRSVCTQNVFFTPDKVRTYKLKLSARAESRTGNAGAWIKIFDAKGTLISHNGLPETALADKKKWAPYEIAFTATPDMAKAEIGFFLSGKGKAWFDDFSLEETTIAKKPSKIARQYMKEVCTAVKKHSWYKDSVDIDQLCESALQLVADAENESDCYKGISYILDRLGDNLARFYDPVTVKNLLKESKQDEESIIYPTASLVEGKYVHIYLPGIVSNNRTTLTRYADTLHRQLATLDKDKIKGWIIDIRENVGGNATAMLAAIGPILNDGINGYYIRTNEKKEWTYKNGTAHMDTTTVTIANPFTFPRKDLPVAVLTEGQTYGAAEAIGVALKSLPHIFYIGEATAGATGNEKRITLSNGAMLFLTTGALADAKGNIYSGRLIPNVRIKPHPNKDYCLARAIIWLNDFHDEEKKP